MDLTFNRGELRRGREELRAALLRSCLLHLEKAESKEAVFDILSRAGLAHSEIDHDTSWISLATARLVLEQVIERIGEDAIRSRAEFATRPGVLGMYVSLLRRATDPLSAYRFIPGSSNESWRVGVYTIESEALTSATLRYSPSPEAEVDQGHRCFCLLRQAELSAIPRLWNLPEATVTEERCIAKGDLCCVYHVEWQSLDRNELRLRYAVIGAALGLPSLATLDPRLLPVISTCGAGIGYLLGSFESRRTKARAIRAFEQNRIIALEHGLEQYGHLAARAGDLTHSILGGKYKILRTVGSGGIGTVYAAEHLGLGFQVAVKVLRGAAAMDASEVARLRREARVQMSIEHPNVVRTFDLDQLPDGTLYVVMELLQGISLQEQMRRSRPLPPSLAVPVFIQACRALSAAHRLGIVHRDLKPGNIFLCEGGVVKVLDFGMSKLAEEETLTQEGYTLGTPEYMSPEQCVGTEVDPRSDIYAFGVLMYEALSGELPFRGRSRQALLEHHQRSTPKPILTLRPGLALPPELDRVVMACLKKRPSERPQSAQQLERLLAAVPPLTAAEAPPNAPELDIPARPKS